MPQRIHIRRAGKKAVYNRRHRLKKRISCLEKDDFVSMMQDEAFFIHDSMTGRKYWSQVGNPIGVPYTGSHKKITMYGAVARDGRQFFRAYDKFDSSTFVRYLKEMQKHFGKVAVIADRTPQHRSKAVKELLRKNKNIRIIHLPKGSPYLNAVEECWHHGKRVLLVSEYYKTFLDMRQAISLYYRTVRFNLDLFKFVNRKYPVFMQKFLIFTTSQYRSELIDWFPENHSCHVPGADQAMAVIAKMRGNDGIPMWAVPDYAHLPRHCKILDWVKKIMSERKPFRGTRRKEPFLTIEEKVEQFVLRNSRNGFFTRISTIHDKFEVSEERTWEIVGTLLTGGTLESTHDPVTGEMKLCEIDKTYSIIGKRRKVQKHSKRDSRKLPSKRDHGNSR